jgi:putative endonuclease
MVCRIDEGLGMETDQELQREYVYVLQCADGTFYTGWTTDLEHRVAVHNSGKGAKYTRSRLPVELVYYELYEDRSVAKRREYAIKKLTRAEKEKLVSSMKK